MFSEITATIQAADPDTARFIARRLMQVWEYYLPFLGIQHGDYDITTTVTELTLEDDHDDTALTRLLEAGGEAVA